LQLFRQLGIFALTLDFCNALRTTRSPS
jgi:hypothetical protein